MTTPDHDPDTAFWAQLARPFHPSQFKHRDVAGRGGATRTLSYIDAEDVMDRLDEIGPANWRDSYRWDAGGVVCRLSVRGPDGAWVTKSDAGGYPDMTVKTKDGQVVPDLENSFKGAFSDALKRAARKFGIGRRLQDTPAAATNGNGSGNGYVKQRHEWPSAKAPRSDQSSVVSRHSRGSQSPSGLTTSPLRTDDFPEGNGHAGDDGSWLRSGARFWGYLKDHRCEGRAVEIGRELGLPGRVSSWTREQIKEVDAILREEALSS